MNTTRKDDIDRHIANLAKACQPILKQMRQVIKAMNELDNNPNFHLLVKWIKAKEETTTMKTQKIREPLELQYGLYGITLYPKVSTVQDRPTTITKPRTKGILTTASERRVIERRFYQRVNQCVEDTGDCELADIHRILESMSHDKSRFDYTIIEV